jgi:nucleoside-diphosphate-sugar epimerase
LKSVRHTVFLIWRITNPWSRVLSWNFRYKRRAKPVFSNLTSTILLHHSHTYNENMTGELVLLTGGTGFLGYAILVDLLKSGYRVRAAARSQSKVDKVLAAPSISALDPSSDQLTFVMVPDMTAPGAYDDAVQGVDLIVHVAAPLPSGEASSDKAENALVKVSVEGSLAILKSANEKGKTVRRIVMTSSTVAIAPADVYATDTKEREILRGPDNRVIFPPPPYDSQLRAYCASKAAALHAAEAFVRDNATDFDLISIMPSWVFGKDELFTNTQDIRTDSTKALINGLLTGNQGYAAVGNVVLCADVARAHVRALDPDIKGNQSFILSTEVNWEDTIPIAKKYFPGAFASGLFKEGSPQPTLPISWDCSKVRIFSFIVVELVLTQDPQTLEVLGIELATYEAMVKEVVGQYLELAEKEKK